MSWPKCGNGCNIPGRNRPDGKSGPGADAPGHCRWTALRLSTARVESAFAYRPGRLRREIRLSGVIAFANGVAFLGRRRFHGRKARLVELAHRLLVDDSGFVKAFHGFMDGCHCFAFVGPNHR